MERQQWRPAPPDGTARRVIVGIDDTSPGQAALRWAVRGAAADDARLIAVRAWALGLTRLAVADGDLLVLGDQQGSSMKRIVHGSLSRYCTSHSKCPVVIISSAAAEYDRPAKSAEIRPDRGRELPDDAQVRGAL
jgi:nucleotide-binding universal stress UspA family protein